MAKTVSEYADAIMVEIDNDIEEGLVPATVSSFSELHDYVDANMYGDEAKMWDDYVGPTPANDDPEYDAKFRAWVDRVNAVTDEVDRRLKARAAKQA